jgi:hypothetical protein
VRLRPHRWVLAVGTFLFAIEALYVNLSRPLGYQTPHILDSLGFAVLLFSLGYVAVQNIFSSERRLMSIESELATAREIQNSILPSSSPGLKNLRITAAYRRTRCRLDSELCKSKHSGMRRLLNWPKRKARRGSVRVVVSWTLPDGLFATYF